MPITVRIAHTARIALERLTPRMRNMAKCGIAEFAGWWPAKRPASAMKAAARSNKAEDNCGEDETDGLLHEEAGIACRWVGRTIFRLAASPDELED
jgi:hypothetical protein